MDRRPISFGERRKIGPVEPLEALYLHDAVARSSGVPPLDVRMHVWIGHSEAAQAAKWRGESLQEWSPGQAREDRSDGASELALGHPEFTLAFLSVYDYVKEERVRDVLWGAAQILRRMQLERNGADVPELTSIPDEEVRGAFNELTGHLMLDFALYLQDSFGPDSSRVNVPMLVSKGEAATSI